MKPKKPYGVCIVGAYDLHLYCANVHNERVTFPEEIADCQTKAQAFKNARARGWKIVEGQDLAYCPKCVKEGRI